MYINFECIEYIEMYLGSFFLIVYLCVNPEFFWELNFVIIHELQDWYFQTVVGTAVKYMRPVLFEY